MSLKNSEQNNFKSKAESFTIGEFVLQNGKTAGEKEGWKSKM